MNIRVCSLGPKGFAVLRSIHELTPAISLTCEVATDPHVLDDYSDAVLEYCRNTGIPVVNRGESAALLQPDLILAAGWRWMIGAAEAPRLVVFHDSLLPRYRGFAPLVNALLNREHEIGVTALFGADQYDRGNIIAQRKLDVSYPTTIGREIERIVPLYGSLAVDVVRLLLSEPQHKGTSQEDRHASYSLWRDHEDYRVRWCDSAEDIAHFIACVGPPYLGAVSLIDGRPLRIFKATPLEDVRIEIRSSGKVLFLEDGFPTIVCGRGLLRIEDARYEDGSEFLPLRRFRTRLE